MQDKINKLLQEKLDSIMESVDLTDSSDWELIEFDDEVSLDGLIYAEDFVNNLNSFLESDDDELEIEYYDGDSVILERSIVKDLVENHTEAELETLADSAKYLNKVISEMYDIEETNNEDPE